ncbi:helix-turn-helix domain-containing protein [Streptomyces vilmorinianum]|uniref:helix-turn-helix domain-containing protein n=1 Tax=Streptomyces vilmorinianum TaxID=3051092 RepID=UPI0010FBA242|nr:helix-turn-helix domain-containing protein [Streptomyces vilmorinianum]
MAAGDAPDDDAARRLGTALRAMQQRSGCTLRDLESRMPISDSSLSRYFRGSTVPPWGTVLDLCRALGADPAAYRALWEAAERNQSQPQPQPQSQPQPAAATGDSANRPSGLRPWHRIARPGSRGRWISAMAGGVIGAVLGSLVTWFVLPSPDAPVGPARGAEVVSDGTAAESGPGSSDTARIFVNRATGACLDHSLDKKLRAYACNGMSYQRWTVHKLPDGTRRVRNHATGACLDHGEKGLRSVDCDPSTTQKWSVTAWPDDSVELRSRATGACLDDSATAGLRALPCTRTNRQKWG